MKYLLDTCVVSDFVKYETHTVEKMKATAPALLAISSVTLMEIRFGLALNPNLAKKLQPIMKAFIATINIVPFGDEEAEEAAHLRAFLKLKGKTIGNFDTLIAGTALAHQLILVTSNTSEFSRVPNLVSEDWRMKVN